jgi:Xaa-Pro aminopeptidase
VKKKQEQLIARIQEHLRSLEVPAWLFYDFRKSDSIAYQILNLDTDSHPTRRWFYLVPASGTPQKLVHRIESDKLDQLPGEKHVYVRWEELEAGLERILNGYRSIAMQYSPKGAIPYVSMVDGGILELIRGLAIEVTSSADLIQHFESILTEHQIETHRTAAQAITTFVQDAFAETQQRISDKGATDEYQIQQYLMERFRNADMETDYPPIVAVNENSGNPHYCPTAESCKKIRAGDFLLIDLWAKKNQPESAYADITWTAFFGEPIPEEILSVFKVVKRARDRGVEFLRTELGSGNSVQGWQVDDVVRGVISAAGYSDFVLHRTGHNIGREVHASGVNFDNFETHDTRLVLAGMTCTIEPGIYLKDFGVRSELNILIEADGPVVTTPTQDSLLQFRL